MKITQEAVFCNIFGAIDDVECNRLLLLLLLNLLLTRRLAWRLVQKLQGHVTHKKRRRVRR